jgi:hypothetical protein
LVEDIEKNKTKEELEILNMKISKVENEIVQVNKDLTMVIKELTIVDGWLLTYLIFSEIYLS